MKFIIDKNIEINVETSYIEYEIKNSTLLVNFHLKN